jgi:hypothetical protein
LKQTKLKDCCDHGSSSPQVSVHRTPLMSKNSSTPLQTSEVATGRARPWLHCEDPRTCTGTSQSPQWVRRLPIAYSASSTFQHPYALLLFGGVTLSSSMAGGSTRAVCGLPHSKCSGQTGSGGCEPAPAPAPDSSVKFLTWFQEISGEQLTSDLHRCLLVSPSLM